MRMCSPFSACLLLLVLLLGEAELAEQKMDRAYFIAAYKDIRQNASTIGHQVGQMTIPPSAQDMKQLVLMNATLDGLSQAYTKLLASRLKANLNIFAKSQIWVYEQTTKKQLSLAIKAVQQDLRGYGFQVDERVPGISTPVNPVNGNGNQKLTSFQALKDKYHVFSIDIQAVGAVLAQQSTLPEADPQIIATQLTALQRISTSIIAMRAEQNNAGDLSPAEVTELQGILGLLNKSMAQQRKSIDELKKKVQTS